MKHDEGVRAPGTHRADAHDAAPIGLASTSIPVLRRVLASPPLGVALAIAAFTLIGATQSSQFFDGSTWINILGNATFPAIVACFEALVLISGGLDLSVGATLLAGAMTASALAEHGASDVLAIAAAVALGAGIGAFNAVLINGIGISSIIATLATLFAVTAVVTTVSGGLPVGPLPARFTTIGETRVGTVPLLLFYALAIAAAAHVLLEYTPFGTRIRATGGNREAARALGLKPALTSSTVYVLCGAFAAVAGVLEASQLGAGDPTLGTGLELEVIAAVVIGGTSIYGAIGSIPGAVLGAILLSLLTTGIILLHFSGQIQDLVVGIVIILAATLDRLRKRRMFRTSVDREIQQAADRTPDVDQTSCSA